MMLMHYVVRKTGVSLILREWENERRKGFGTLPYLTLVWDVSNGLTEIRGCFL